MTIRNKFNVYLHPELMQRKNILKSKLTDAELKFESILKKHNIKYRSQKGFFIGNSYRIVDFYIPHPIKVAIEIDGIYHNNTKSYDFKKDTLLFEERDIKTVRLTNDFVLNNPNLETFILNLCSFKNAEVNNLTLF